MSKEIWWGSVFIASFVGCDVNSDNGNQSQGQFGVSVTDFAQRRIREQSGTSSTDVSLDGTNVLVLCLLMEEPKP